MSSWGAPSKRAVINYRVSPVDLAVDMTYEHYSKQFSLKYKFINIVSILTELLISY